MKNKEKYAKKFLEIACIFGGVDKRTGELKCCGDMSCFNCLFNGSKCVEKMKEWAEAEYTEKPVISKRDRAFLDYIGNTYKFICRDKDYKLFVCKDVHTDGRMWFSRWCIAGSDYTYISGFEVQFPMIEVVSPTVWSIEDLKKLEVVEKYGTD